MRSCAKLTMATKRISCGSERVSAMETLDCVLARSSFCLLSVAGPSSTSSDVEYDRLAVSCACADGDIPLSMSLSSVLDDCGLVSLLFSMSFSNARSEGKFSSLVSRSMMI